MQISFAENYQQKINSGILKADVEQQHVVEQMQLAYEDIEKFYQSNSDFKIKKLLPFSLDFSLDKVQKSVKGIYLWGDVGRGKTFLLDMFFECLSLKNKLRIHFHRFMQMIHESIEELGDIEAPLKATAKYLAKKHKIICLDEILVIDIADAMILAELFKHLIDNGVTLLFTSNIAPENLYKNGLQRARFLPAIELISTSSVTIELKGDDDYRLHVLEKTEVYQLNSDAEAEVNLQRIYDIMAGVKLHQDRDDLIINYRRLPVKKWESGIVWFSFDMICNTHRDSSDYIRIATFFHTVLVSEIYCLDAEQDDIVRRFINMIDVFYDRHINLIVSAQTLPNKLYSGTRLQFEFSRTKSRLIEMQTKKYLAKHKVFKEKLENQLSDIKLNKENEFSEINDPTRFGDWVSNNGRCSDF
jgi:cell division protein ZapE